MSDHIRNSTIARTEDIIKYRFTNSDICWEAVQIAGSGVDRIGGRNTTRGNQNLAIVGNSAMKTVMVKAWRDTDTTKGDWQKRCSTVLSNANLAIVGYSSQMDLCLHRNPMNPVPTSDNLAATLVEAVCGAVFEDGGLEGLAQVMQVLGVTLCPCGGAPEMTNAKDFRGGFDLDPSRKVGSRPFEAQSAPVE